LYILKIKFLGSKGEYKNMMEYFYENQGDSTYFNVEEEMGTGDRFRGTDINILSYVRV